jgi:hypothetical protein
MAKLPCGRNCDMGGERDGEMIIQPETRSAVQCSYDMMML